MPVDAIYTCFSGFNCNEIVIKMNQFADEIGMTNTRKNYGEVRLPSPMATYFQWFEKKGKWGCLDGAGDWSLGFTWDLEHMLLIKGQLQLGF